MLEKRTVPGGMVYLASSRQIDINVWDPYAATGNKNSVYIRIHN